LSEESGTMEIREEAALSAVDLVLAGIILMRSW
jgi:hypothetical protein